MTSSSRTACMPDSRFAGAWSPERSPQQHLIHTRHDMKHEIAIITSELLGVQQILERGPFLRGHRNGQALMDCSQVGPRNIPTIAARPLFKRMTSERLSLLTTISEIHAQLLLVESQIAALAEELAAELPQSHEPGTAAAPASWTLPPRSIPICANIRSFDFKVRGIGASPFLEDIRKRRL